MKNKKGIIIIASILIIIIGTAVFFLNPDKSNVGNSDGNGSQGEVVDDMKDHSSSALVAKPMEDTVVVENPYLASTESCMHNDIYNSDVTAYNMPLGINTEVRDGYSDERSFNCPPAFFYDSYGNAIAPYTQMYENGTIISGGVAIIDMDSDEELPVLGVYMPETSAQGIQISYSFVDSNSYLVGPTVNGHVKYIKTVDENGNVLPEFEIVLDVDLISTVQKNLSQNSKNPNGIDVNILSISYDYEGNLWFASGGFLMDPTNPEAKQGFYGYLSQEYIANNLGKDTWEDPSEYIHAQAFDTATTIDVDGEESVLYTENVENGISANSEGCLILSNKQCYLFSADANETNAIKTNWQVPYESVGRKVAPDDGTEDGSGAGLAWGGGSSPTLTNDLAIFTDNLDVINLYAVDVYTGEVVIKTPVLDIGVPVSVENSVCVYSDSNGKTSILVCNWLGAGKNYIKDSSVQKFDVLYDNDWRAEGSKYLFPGVQRIDITNENGKYTSEIIWTREDLKDTSMIKLSTGAGYYYGYLQDEKTSQWGFTALDYETGETVLWVPVSDEPTYNNIAIGIMQGDTGNVIYCPTNSKTLVSIRDRFVYLPGSDSKLDITTMSKIWISDDTIQGKKAQTPLLSVKINKEDVKEHLDEKGNLEIAFCVNGLTGNLDDYSAYIPTNSEYSEIEFEMLYQGGEQLGSTKELKENVVYEVRISMPIQEDEQTVSVVLAKD